jgi:hypothetical protein
MCDGVDRRRINIHQDHELRDRIKLGVFAGRS